VELVRREEESLRLERFVKHVGFKPGVKRVTDEESVESREEDDVTDVE